MIIDDKAHGDYKMIRAKVIDQCGSCAPTQVDLSQTAFEHLAKKSTGVVNMIYVIVNKSTGEIMDGPHYNSSAMESFAKSQGVSKSTVVNSFKQAARAMNKDGAKGMSSFPWENGKIVEDDDDYEEEKKTTTRKTTTRKTTTTTTKKTTTTTTTKKTTTTTTVVKTSHAVFPTVAKTTTVAFPTVAKVSTTAAATATASSVPVVPITPIVEKPAHKEETTKPAKPVEKPVAEEEKEEEKPQEIDDFDKENGGTDAPVTAGVIGGTAAIVGAAGVGLLMLKRKSPQKYDDLKQRFPEAFGTVKRSLTRGASTIKRGVSRSVSRRGNQQNTPLPASYTFTLSSEDGLPRVALYDDPYPTKTHGTQHW
jgi:hypothetical protein